MLPVSSADDIFFRLPNRFVLLRKRQRLDVLQPGQRQHSILHPPRQEVRLSSLTYLLVSQGPWFSGPRCHAAPLSLIAPPTRVDIVCEM